MMETFEKRRYEKERDKLLRQIAMVNLRQAVTGEDLTTEEYDSYMSEFKSTDKLLKTNEEHKVSVFNDKLKIPVEIGKVVVPVMAYFSASKFWAKFEESGTVRTAAARALEGHKIRFF